MRHFRQGNEEKRQNPLSTVFIQYAKERANQESQPNRFGKILSSVFTLLGVNKPTPPNINHQLMSAVFPVARFFGDIGFTKDLWHSFHQTNPNSPLRLTAELTNNPNILLHATLHESCFLFKLTINKDGVTTTFPYQSKVNSYSMCNGRYTIIGTEKPIEYTGDPSKALLYFAQKLGEYDDFKPLASEALKLFKTDSRRSPVQLVGSEPQSIIQ